MSRRSRWQVARANIIILYLILYKFPFYRSASHVTQVTSRKSRKSESQWSQVRQAQLLSRAARRMTHSPLHNFAATSGL